MAFAIALALVAVLGLRPRFAVVPLALAALLAVPVGVVKGADRAGDRVIYEAETEYQYARVVEHPDGVRELELNEGQAVHSRWQRDSVLTGNYWDAFLVDPAAALGRAPRSVAVLGAGAGTMVRAYEHYFPRTRIDAVEIDGDLFDIGKRYFGLRERPGVRLVADDARPFLRRTGDRYDAIFVDAYRQPYIPFHLSTREFFELVRDRLAPGGVMLINIGHPDTSDDLERVLTATVRSAFPHVLRDPVEKVNTVLMASAAPLSGGRLLDAVPELPADLQPIARRAALRMGPALSGGEVYTDDRAPVEWLIDKSIVNYAAK
jgi:spermidine synthase